MGKKKKRSMWPAEGESSSSCSSSTDDKSTDESTRKRSEGRRKNRKKEGEAIGMVARLMEEKISKLIIKNHEDQCKRLEKLTESHNDLRTQWDLMKDDVSEVRKQLEKFIESHIDQCKRLEMFTESHHDMCKQLDVHTNGTSTETSASLRSQLNQVQIPRYKLQFQSWQIGESVEKDQIMEISVALIDIYSRETLRHGSLASAIVELVVVDGNFDKNDNMYEWSREEFETSIIKKAREENSATRDVDQSLKSTVSNGRFQLVQGFGSHSGSTIFRNSGNRKIRLGVMVVSPTEERVLEGLSKPFLVRGHDRPGRQSNKSNRQRLNIFAGQPDLRFQGNTNMITQEQWDLIQQYQSMEQAGNNRADGNEWSPALLGFLGDQNFMDDNHVSVNAIGTEFNMDPMVLPVQLIWNRPNVEPSKHHWNLLDQFMPLHSCQPKSNKWLLPSMLLMSEHFGSLTIVSKNVMQTRRRGSVLIEPLEPDDSDDERRPLNSKLHNKYRLRFVNKVCEAYFTWEQIKAFDGRDLKVALFDENNMRITSGPLSSASVEVVALHGDFDDGQRYWTQEEFSRCVVCPRHGKEASVLGGDRILVLADGEACLGDTFFQRTSYCARTGMFKLGVMLASAHAERIQEGISEQPLLVKDRPSAGLPLGFLYPTDEELIMVDIPCRDAAVASHFSVPFMAEDRNKQYEPLDIPAANKAVSDEYVPNLLGSLKSPPMVICAQDYRKQHVESNKQVITLRRSGTLDGRKLAPDEDPQVIPSRRPMKTSPLTVSTLTSASASLLAVPASVPVKEDSASALEKAHSVVLLLATLAAAITYQAGLNPPGGFWQENGDPILLTKNPRRYKAYYYCNSIAFVASLVAIVLVGIKTPHYHHNALRAVMIVDLFGIIGAYTAGSSRDVSTFMSLAGAILFYVGTHIVFHKGGRSRGNDEASLAKEKKGKSDEPADVEMDTRTENRAEESSAAPGTEDGKDQHVKRKKVHAKRKCLMLLGITVASITYKAGLAPPGGAWQSNDGVHTAGNPVMHDIIRRPRYLAFFYSNSVSFVASVVLIVLLLRPSLHEKPLWLRVMNATIVLDVLGLLISYATGTSRTWKTSVIVSALVVAVLGYFAIHLALSWISCGTVVSASSQPNGQHDKETARST